MKFLQKLIIKVYRIAYKVTGLPFLSYLLALVYIAALHFITLYGLTLLSMELAPTGVILRLYRKPYAYVLAIVFLAINYYVTPPYKSILPEGKKESSYSFLIFYTAIAIVLLCYVLFTLIPN